jgi:hypothetical protein
MAFSRATFWAYKFSDLNRDSFGISENIKDLCPKSRKEEAPCRGDICRDARHQNLNIMGGEKVYTITYCEMGYTVTEEVTEFIVLSIR